MSNQSNEAISHISWKTIASEKIFQTKNFEVMEDIVRLPQGQEIVYSYIKKNPGICVVPIFPDRQILLIKQYRYLCEKECWELLAGRIRTDETPKTAAIRELEEEGGYEASNLRLLDVVYSSPGVCNETVYTYLATELSPKLRKPEITEVDSIVQRFAIEECVEMVIGGIIISAVDALVLLKLYTMFQQDLI